MTLKTVLAIETSCDDTSVAVVTDTGVVLQVISAHQNAAHEVFGGIVPEIASRNHTYHLLPLIETCLERAGMTLKDVDGIAVTSKPGLIGSLMVGVVTAKSLALVTGLPFIGVNHLEGHLLAPFLRDMTYAPPDDFVYPYIALAVSGGHTSLYRIDGLGEYRVLGQTVDDAAGEAFDKFGKILGLGFPGGVRVDRHSRLGIKDRYQFPRAMMRETHFNFSFSGSKAAGQRFIDALSESERADLQEDARLAMPPPLVTKILSGQSSDPKTRSADTAGSALAHTINEVSETVTQSAVVRPGILADLCASFQESIVDVLLERLSRAVASEGLTRAVLTGGVSANSRLRERAMQWADESGVQMVVPPIRYCTDNAAMIGFAGIGRMNRGEFSTQTLGPEPKAPLGHAPLPENFPAKLTKSLRNSSSTLETRTKGKRS